MQSAELLGKYLLSTIACHTVLGTGDMKVNAIGKVCLPRASGLEEGKRHYANSTIVIN